MTANTTTATRPALDVDAVRDLHLFAVNDAWTHNYSVIPTAANLDRKRRRGIYDPARAVAAWQYVADYAARRYADDFGGRWCSLFPPAVRREVARILASDYDANAI